MTTIRPRARLVEALAAIEPYGFTVSAAQLLNDRGELARRRADYDAARALDEASLARFRSRNHRAGMAMVLHNLGYVALHQNDPQQAEERFRQALAFSRELHSDHGVALCLAGLGGVAVVQADWPRAARLLGSVAARLAPDGPGMAPDEPGMAPVDRAEFERHRSAALENLGPAAFEAAWAHGCAMTLDQAITTYALDGQVPVPAAD